MKQKKSQVWGVDLMIAVFIFMIGIATFYLYTINMQNNEEKFESLKYDGELIGDSLLSQGFPIDWNSVNVIKIGIAENGKINETKLERFYNLSIQNYAITKVLFNTRYDYFFFLSENLTINSQPISGIGLEPGNTENLVKITRLAIYKDKPVEIYIYVWE